MNSRKTILIVDDETKIRRLVVRVLEANGYDVCAADDGERALEVWKISSSKPDLVLMDVMMPGMDGFECARRLRTMAPNVPVIFLSARSEPAFKLQGFRSGADDYVTKPFMIEELVARIQAVLRRIPETDGNVGNISDYENGPLRLNASSRKVWVGNSEIHLADTEFRLLQMLIKVPGHVVSYEALLNAVWGDENIGEVQYLRVAFTKIRRKLEEAGLEGGVISSYSKVGYILRDLVRDPIDT